MNIRNVCVTPARSIMLILLSVMCLFLMSPEPLAENELTNGVDLYEKGRYEEASVFFKQYLETHPDHPEALYYLGTMEMNGAASQQFFRTLWIKHPNHPFAADALYAICQYHYVKGYYITAGKMFRDLVAHYPESDVADDAAYWAASCQLAAAHPDSALAIWQKFLEKYPKSDKYDWAVLGIGDALYALTRYKEACSEYLKIVDSPFRDELKSMTLYKLGGCYEKLGDDDAARKYYEKVVEHFPHGYERLLISGEAEYKPASHVRASDAYTIQVGAFTHKENAVKLHNTLAEKGYDVTVTTEYTHDRKLLHAVHVGSYPTVEQARSVAERLEREEGFQPHIEPKDQQ